MKKVLFILGLLAAVHAQAKTTKKVLVVLSSENKISLKNGAKPHPTGYFLTELVEPLVEFEKEGFTPVFANPLGNEPAMDPVSNNKMWFNNNEKALADALEVVARHSRSSEEGSLSKPKKLSEIPLSELKTFAGIFVPGGHAPMEDLVKDADLGKILAYFHKAKKPTGLICHGPIALISALPEAKEFTQALERGITPEEMERFSKNWIYKGYKMTSFSTKEEQQEEPGQDNVLGGFVKFYPDEALGYAGGNVLVNAIKWRSNVIKDRELITGENPMSAPTFGRVYTEALKRSLLKK